MPESATLELIAPDADATVRLGAHLARALDAASAAPLVIGLTGELGAGKTTLVRGILRALGVTGTVRSPTFTLLENYSVPRTRNFSSRPVPRSVSAGGRGARSPRTVGACAGLFD